MIVYFSNYISVRRALPKPLCFWFGCSNHKSTGYIWLTTYFFIFKHKTYIYFCILCYFDTELRVIEPFIIALVLDMLSELLKSCFFCFVYSCFLKTVRTFSTISFRGPLRLNRIYFPTLREYFINSYFIELHQEISEAHPPWSVWFLCF